MEVKIPKFHVHPIFVAYGNELEGTLTGVDEYTSLQELNMSGNRLTYLCVLPKLERLSSLDVSSNRIVTTLAPMSQCPMLQYVNARDNCIEFTRQAELLPGLTWLSTLCMEGNPLSFKPFYHQRVISRLPTLSTLDKTSVSTEEKVRACNLYVAQAEMCTCDMMCSGSTSPTRRLCCTYPTSWTTRTCCSPTRWLAG